MTSNEGRDLDIVVFGATGYTGTYVVEELAKCTNDIKFAVAGRSRKKLEELVAKLSSEFDCSEKPVCFENIEVIIADVSERETINSMCKKTKLVINCVGPYRFYGEQVVKECVENSTHYVDVSGEPQFLEEMQLKYFDDAKAKGIYIIGSCGLDSVPCDLGVEIFKDKFDGDVNSIETFLQFVNKNGNPANFATWQSAIYGLAHASELKILRKQLKENLFRKARPVDTFPVEKRSVLFKKDDFWCIPFIGSDKSVVTRTQYYNYEFKNQRPVQIQTYMRVPSLLHAVGALFLGLIFGILVKFSCGQRLLENYPEFFSAGIFSKTVPPKEKPSSSSFSITFEGRGWSRKLKSPSDLQANKPDKYLKAVYSFPDGPYTFTAISVVSCALIILSESEKLPSKGGVFTPGAAFNCTSLPQRLEARGASFDIISSS